MIGAGAMAMSSLNVVYNSLRLKKANIEPGFKGVFKETPQKILKNPDII